MGFVWPCFMVNIIAFSDIVTQQLMRFQQFYLILILLFWGHSIVRQHCKWFGKISVKLISHMEQKFQEQC